MPRRQRRNFDALYDAMEVDQQLPGAAVSDDIQMVYNVGDFEPFTRNTLMIGGFNTGAGRHLLQIEIKNPLGAIIHLIVDQTRNPAAGSVIIVRSQPNAEPMTGAIILPWAINEGAPGISVATKGQIDPNQSPSPGFVLLKGFPLLSGTPGMFLRFGRFLLMINNVSGQEFNALVYMSELGREGTPPLISI